MAWLLIPAVMFVGAWLYGAQKVVTNAPPIPVDPIKPDIFLAKNGSIIKVGSVIDVDLLEMNDKFPDNNLLTAMVPLLGNLKNGTLIANQHIDDTLVFKVSFIHPLQPLAQEPSVMAVLFDSRIGFPDGSSDAFKDLAKSTGNEIPVSCIRSVLPGT